MNARLSVQGDGENGKDDGPGGEGVAQGRDSVSKVPRSVFSGHVGIDVCHRVARACARSSALRVPPLMRHDCCGVPGRSRCPPMFPSSAGCRVYQNLPGTRYRTLFLEAIFVPHNSN